MWEKLVGTDGWVPRSTNEGPSGKDEGLVEASSRWCKRSAPLRHPDKWSTRLWEKLTDDGCTCTHPSSTRHFDELVYERSWPTADVRIRHQRGTPTRWGLALLHRIRINTITRAARPLSPRLLRNNSMACGRSDGATIRPDVLDTTRGLGLGSTTW